MAEETTAPKSGNLSLSVFSRWQGSLKWRIAYTYSGLILILGLFMIGVVYQSMNHALRTQIDRRVSTITANLSDAAAGLMSSRQSLEMRALVARYSRIDGVAYVFVEDQKGAVAAHSLKSFPHDLLRPLTVDERRETESVTQKYRGKLVYETRAPILNGQLGAVHVGMWGDAVEAEVKRSLFSVVALIAAGVAVNVIFAVLLAHGIFLPIRQLTDAEGKVSTGDLETPIIWDSKDEVGELAQSLERMRSSLKAAIWWLSRAH
jgi:two-component system cell cycle sensor histidine kinase/response regulator CckA